MKLQEFYSEITNLEGKKVQISIGQIREVVKIVRLFLLKNEGTDLYSLIRKIK